MNFKQPIASNQETNKRVTKETQFKASNQDFSQQQKKKKKKNPQNRDLVVTSTRESLIVIVLELFCGFRFAPPWRR